MATERRNPYTKEQIKELRRLNALSVKTRGSDKRDSENRKAGDEFVRVILETQNAYNPPLTWPELAEPLGIAHRTLRAKVGRRVGGDLLPPSQKPYTGVPYNENRRTETHFSCGHPKANNSYWNRTLKMWVCATHQREWNERSRARAPEERRKLNRRKTVG